MKFAKVIFLDLSVSHSVHRRVLPQCMMGTPPREQTPPGSKPPITRHPPGAEFPPDQAPTPQGADTIPWKRHPPESRHPPCTVHAGIYGQQAGGTHPSGMQFCYVSVTVLNIVLVTATLW